MQILPLPLTDWSKCERNKKIRSPIKDPRKKLCTLSHVRRRHLFRLSYLTSSNISRVGFLVAERDVSRYFRVRFLYWKSLLRSLLFCRGGKPRVSSIEMRSIRMPTINFLIIIEGKEARITMENFVIEINKFMVCTMISVESIFNYKYWLTAWTNVLKMGLQ